MDEVEVDAFRMAADPAPIYSNGLFLGGSMSLEAVGTRVKDGISRMRADLSRFCCGYVSELKLSFSVI